MRALFGDLYRIVVHWWSLGGWLTTLHWSGLFEREMNMRRAYWAIRPGVVTNQLECCGIVLTSILESMSEPGNFEFWLPPHASRITIQTIRASAREAGADPYATFGVRKICVRIDSGGSTANRSVHGASSTSGVAFESTMASNTWSRPVKVPRNMGNYSRSCFFIRHVSHASHPRGCQRWSGFQKERPNVGNLPQNPKQPSWK